MAHVPTVMAGCLVVMVGISMVFALRPANPISIALGLLAVGMGAVLARNAYRAHVSLTSEALRESGDLRGRTFPIEEIDEFVVDRSPHILPWFSIQVRLSSGESHQLQQARVLEWRAGDGFARMEQAVAEMNGRLPPRSYS